MKIKIFKYLILFSVTILFSTCKKYPEGGYERKGDKMIFNHNGAWTLTLYEVNGIDSTDLINYNGNEDYKKINFLKETGNNSHTMYAEHYPSFDYIINFFNNNTEMLFTIENTGYAGLANTCITNNSFYSGCYRLIFNPEGQKLKWNVIKLTKKEFILQTTQINSYKIKLKAR